MRIPMICLDKRLGNYLQQFRDLFTKPQYKYFVTILLAMMICQENKTLSSLLRQLHRPVTLSGLSRFFSQAPWSETAVSQRCQQLFQQQLGPQVQNEHNKRRQKRSRRQGRPRKTVVTGYLIGDDSVMHKQRGKKMGGLGRHFSSTAEKTVTGHCLVQGLYVILGRRCPLMPQMYRQKAVCEQEDVPFRSKIDIMIDIITQFTPLNDTQTHVLLDSWYTCKRVWRAIRDQDYLVTSGLKCNRQLRLDDDSHPQGWYWQRVDLYAAQLKDSDFTRVIWPSQTGESREVYVHVVNSRIKKLYRCQVIFVRESLSGKTKYWASSDLTADMKTLVAHIARRWDIEVLFADVKELLGIDQYQLVTAQAIRRFWLLTMVAYTFLEQERVWLTEKKGIYITIGDAWRHTRRVHWAHFLTWLHRRFNKFGDKPHELCAELLA